MKRRTRLWTSRLYVPNRCRLYDISSASFAHRSMSGALCTVCQPYQGCNEASRRSGPPSMQDELVPSQCRAFPP